MKFVHSTLMALLGMIWMIAFACAYQYWHWNGIACLIGSLPGLGVFLANAVSENIK